MTGQESLIDARERSAKLIAEKVDPLLTAGALPPMWPWWLPLVDEIVKAADLAQALEPFVRASHFYTADTNNDYTLRVKGEDIRRARAALGWDDE